MNKKLIDILVYLFRRYPHLNELSKTRIVKLVYLIDWKNCLSYNKQMTPIKWIFNHYGPYVDDVMNSITENHKIFDVENYINGYGGDSLRIKLIDKDYSPVLTDNEKIIVDFIIEKTKTLNFNELINLVYSTYPIKHNPQYSELDLAKEAEQYKLTKSLLT